MQNTDVKAIMKLVAKYLPLYPVTANRMTAESLQIYARNLQDLSLDNIEKAMNDVIKKSKFFPTVAELREAAYGSNTGVKFY